MILRWLQHLLRPGAPTGMPAPPEPPPPPAPPPSSAATPPYYPQTTRRTPNVSKGRVIKPTHIILHHTSGSYVGSVSWCLNPASKVSYHCIISRDGKRTILAQPTQRAWHAGVSEWQGRKSCNNFAIGLAWEGDTYATPLSEDALASAIEYLLPILEAHRIPLSHIIRHADVAPGRKDDCSPAARRQLVQLLSTYL